MDMSPIVAAGAKPLDTRPWWQSMLAAYGLFALAGFLLVLPSLNGPPMLFDSFGISWVWADQFTAEIARGNLYPRWLPLSNAGLGSPAFYYYPPLAFYVAAVFGLAGFSTYASVIGTFGASFTLSGIAAWHWLRERSAAHPLLGGLLFMAAPYHLFDFTRRGALAESFAIAFIPLVALGLQRIANGRSPVLAAVAYAAMIGAHLPLALLASVLLIAPYALWHRRRLPAFAAAVAIGIGLAAIYLMPALLLERYRDGAMLYRNDYLQPAYWAFERADFALGFVASVFIVMGALAALAVALWIKHHDRWALYALVVLAICAGLVPGFWSLPLLPKVQFPYRAIPLAEFALITALARHQIRALQLTMLIPLALLSASFVNQPQRSDQTRLHQLQARHPDVEEYLPAGVIAIDDIDARLDDVVQGRLPPPQVPGKVVEPVFYFPSWSCGSMHEPSKLLMHDPACRPKIVWTREEKAGAMISLLSLIALGLLALWHGATARTVRSFGAAWPRPRTKLPQRA
jgi:hypothetical protein